MVTIQPTITDGVNGTQIARWLAVTENDTGAPVRMNDRPDKTVQVVGDFTTSGAITLEGSQDGTNYATLHDNLGATIVITASTDIRFIAENPVFIRPRATAGTSVAMDVYITAAR